MENHAAEISNEMFNSTVGEFIREMNHLEQDVEGIEG